MVSNGVTLRAPSQITYDVVDGVKRYLNSKGPSQIMSAIVKCSNFVKEFFQYTGRHTKLVAPMKSAMGVLCPFVAISCAAEAATKDNGSIDQLDCLAQAGTFTYLSAKVYSEIGLFSIPSWMDSLGCVTSVCTIFTNVNQAYKGIKDYLEFSEKLRSNDVVELDLRKNYEDKKVLGQIKICKAISKIAGAALTLAGIYAGVSVVFPLAAVSSIAIGALFSVVEYFYKDSSLIEIQKRAVKNQVEKLTVEQLRNPFVMQTATAG